jgi:hypothetical protein
MNHNGDQFGLSQEDIKSEMQSKMQAKYAPEIEKARKDSEQHEAERERMEKKGY